MSQKSASRREVSGVSLPPLSDPRALLPNIPFARWRAPPSCPSLSRLCPSDHTPPPQVSRASQHPHRRGPRGHDSLARAAAPRAPLPGQATAPPAATSVSAAVAPEDLPEEGFGGLGGGDFGGGLVGGLGGGLGPSLGLHGGGGFGGGGFGGGGFGGGGWVDGGPSFPTGDVVDRFLGSLENRLSALEGGGGGRGGGGGGAQGGGAGRGGGVDENGGRGGGIERGEGGAPGGPLGRGRLGSFGSGFFSGGGAVTATAAAAAPLSGHPSPRGHINTAAGAAAHPPFPTAHPHPMGSASGGWGEGGDGSPFSSPPRRSPHGGDGGGGGGRGGRPGSEGGGSPYSDRCERGQRGCEGRLLTTTPCLFCWSRVILTILSTFSLFTPPSPQSRAALWGRHHVGQAAPLEGTHDPILVFSYIFSTPPPLPPPAVPCGALEAVSRGTSHSPRTPVPRLRAAPPWPP